MSVKIEKLIIGLQKKEKKKQKKAIGTVISVT